MRLSLLLLVAHDSSFELNFIPPEKLVEAVMFADVSYLASEVADGRYPQCP